MLKFYWNGIKENGGDLQGAYYWGHAINGYPSGTISISAKGYRSFSAEIRAAFDVTNNSDIYTDYFEKDKIRVTPSHPLYPQVKAAFDAYEARQDRMAAKRAAKRAAQVAA